MLLRNLFEKNFNKSPLDLALSSLRLKYLNININFSNTRVDSEILKKKEKILCIRAR